MKDHIMTKEQITSFENYLIENEKAKSTIEKYVRDVMTFKHFVGDERITKETSIRWKETLLTKGYAVSSINSMLAAINQFFSFVEWNDCKIKTLRKQRSIYCPEEKELSKAEYLKLLYASQRDKRLSMVIQTICGTGIRISELRFFTVDAVKNGEANVRCKGKIRTVIIPGKLRKILLLYAKQIGIKQGAIFITKSGKCLDRSNIWAAMKKLCVKAGVKASKVFPHNLRKLFAKTFYKKEKDIAKLADILGHETIETTRIYIMSTGREHRRIINHLDLIPGI